MFKKLKLSKDEQIWTMTKTWINRLLWFGSAWITWSYVLATYAAISGNYTVCENLSKSVVKFVIATILGYMLKSFFETFCERKNELVREGFDSYSNSTIETEDIEDTEEAYLSDNSEEN